jgi:hypothetical protein
MMSLDIAPSSGANACELLQEIIWRIGLTPQAHCIVKTTVVALNSHSGPCFQIHIYSLVATARKRPDVEAPGPAIEGF